MDLHLARCSCCLPPLLPCTYCRLQVVYGHLDDPQNQELKRGVSYLKLRPGEWIVI
jgi:hypothetical protein